MDDDDPLQHAQALVESAAVHFKEDTYVKLCDALRRVYDAREDAKVFEVVMTRVAADVTTDCDGDPDVAVHMWTHYAQLSCTSLSADDVLHSCKTPLEHLLSGKYQSHWSTRETPFVLQNDRESVTVLRVRSAKRKR